MNTNQLSIDDIATGAIEASGYAANSTWLHTVDRIIEELAASRYEFTADDIWHKLEGSGISTHEPRALGAAIQQAVRAEVIVHTGRYEKSNRPECHRRPISVYRRVS